MTEKSPFAVPVEALEAGSKVAPGDLVESVDEVVAVASNPNGEQPDRDWFAAGG